MTENQVTKETFPEDAAESFLYLLYYFMLCLFKKKLDHFTVVQNICFNCLNCPAFFTANHENCFGIESRSLFGENKPPFLPAIFHPGLSVTKYMYLTSSFCTNVACAAFVPYIMC